MERNAIQRSSSLTTDLACSLLSSTLSSIFAKMLSELERACQALLAERNTFAKKLDRVVGAVLPSQNRSQRKLRERFS
jgi:hypothetical protein